MMGLGNSDDYDDDNVSAAADVVFSNDELVCEILIRLPTKSIMSCKCVSKHWLTLIEQRGPRGLIDLHLARSKAKHPSSLVITIVKRNEIDFFILEDLFEGREAVHWFTTPWSGVVFRDSVNGLICIREAGEEEVDILRIVNPSTREITPSLNSISKRGKVVVGHSLLIDRIPVFGFGCDAYAKEHKVACLWQFLRSKSEDGHLGVARERICEVMTVGENKWRRIDAVPPYNIQDNHVNVNGSIFWMNTDPVAWEATDYDALVAFDVANEKFSVIRIPNHVLGGPQPLLKGRRIDLLEVDGRLAMMHRRESDGKVTLWIIDGVEVVNHDTSATTATWNGTVYTSNWIEETITMPFDDWDRVRTVKFQPIAGTDQIIMRVYEEESQNSSRNSIILHYYHRKKKTFRTVEITGISSLSESFFPYKVSIITQSLLPVQIQKQKQQNPPRTISGSQLGETAKRLVSSLHLPREEQMQSPPYYGAPAPHYCNDGGYHQGQGHDRPMPRGPIHPSRTNARHHPHTTQVQTQFVSGYRHPSASSPANNSYDHHHHHHHHHHRSSYPRHPQNLPAATIHTNDLYRPRMHGGWFQPPMGSPIQNANRLQYLPGNVVVAQTPTLAPVNVHHQRGGGYYSHRGSQQPYYGASSGVLQQPPLVWVPVANQISTVGRGDGHPQQSGNRFSGLGGGSSRRPPPPPPEHDS